MGVIFKILDTPSPEWTGELYEELSLLYEGGHRLAAKANQFLPQQVNEPGPRYAERLQAVGYINYLAEVVDSFVSQVFSSPLAMMPAADAEDGTTAGAMPADANYYRELQNDVDLSGTPLSSMLHDLLVNALVDGKSYLLVDFPETTEAPSSLLEEDAMGASRAYAVPLPIESLTAWKKDSFNNFVWAKVKKVIPVQDDPLDPPDMQRIEFKLWRKTPAGVTWQVYSTPVHPKNNPPKPTDEVPLVAEGTVSFPEIPIVELCADKLWIGNRIWSLVKEHYSRRSALVSAENKSLFSIPVVSLGPEMSAPGEALPGEVQQNPNRAQQGPAERLRNQGFMVLGAGDELSYPEPTGAAYVVVSNQLKELVDEIHRVVHQMAASVSSTANAVGRSGDSKSLDRAATDIVVDALVEMVKRFAKKLFTLISEARGESIVWDAHGLDRTSYPDRDQLLKEALAVGSISIPSPTFKKTYLTRIALALSDGIDPQTANVIRDEIATAPEEHPEPPPDPNEDPNADPKDGEDPDPNDRRFNDGGP